MIKQLLIKFVAVLIASVLAGCAAPPEYVSAHKINLSPTQDSALLRARFGDLVQVVNKYTTFEGTTPIGTSRGFRRLEWEVPGVMLSGVHHSCGARGGQCRSQRTQIYFNPELGKLIWQVDRGGDQQFATLMGIVKSDGSIEIEDMHVSGRGRTIRFDETSNKMIVTQRSTGRSSESWTILSREEYAAALDAEIQARGESAREASRESRQFWSNVAQALQGAAHSYASELDRAAPPAFTNPRLASPAEVPTPSALQAGVVPDRASVGQVNQQVQQQRSGNSGNTAQSNPGAPVHLLPNSSPVASGGPTRSAQSVQQGSKTAQSVSQGVQATSAGVQFDSQRVQRKPYYEAVVVCTIPSGEQGRFVCENPVNRIGGHKDINPREWRTPESMVASFDGSCSNARPLRSTTHRVWGCGFAATDKIVGNYDRAGPGVDVQGRQTFYCVDGEQGCRRTQP